MDFIFQHKELSGVSPLFSHPGQNPSDSGRDLEPAAPGWRSMATACAWTSTDNNTLFVQQGLSSPKTVRISNPKLNLAVIRRNKQILIV